MKKVNEMMETSILSCKKDEALRKVSKRMLESNIGFLPVVDESQKVIGAITDRDLALAIGKTAKSVDDIKVQDIVKQEVHTIHENEDGLKALEIMKAKNIGRLPVVDSQNKLKGIINLTRITREFANKEGAQSLQADSREVMDTIYSMAQHNKKSNTKV